MSKPETTTTEAATTETPKEVTVKIIDTGVLDLADVKDPGTLIRTESNTIKGRMPLPIVHMIKFGESALTDGAMAKKFGTTNGKVSDIRKDRNFSYVTAEYVPSADAIEGAKVYARHLKDASVAEDVAKLKPATAEELAAFDAAKKASRPVKAAKPAEEVKDDAKAEAAPEAKVEGKAPEALKKGGAAGKSDSTLDELTK